MRAFFDPLYSFVVIAVIGLAGSLLAGSWIGAAACALLLLGIGLGSKFTNAFGRLGKLLDGIRREELREAAGWAILAVLGFALVGMVAGLASVFQAVRTDPGLVPTVLLLVLIASAGALKALVMLWGAFLPSDDRQEEAPRRSHLRRAAGSAALAALLAALVGAGYFYCYSGTVHEYCEYLLIPVIVAALMAVALALRVLGSLWSALRGAEY